MTLYPIYPTCPTRRTARWLVASLLSAFASLASLPAAAGVIHSFTGAWAPTAANGFEEATQSIGSFSTSVSADGLVLTSQIANAGDTAHHSFFLQNYSFLTVSKLPQGLVSYDIEITLSSAAGPIYMFTDFAGLDGSYASGSVVTGHYSGLYNGGYFGYFGVNIDDGLGSASARVVLSNFSAPNGVPEPGSLPLLAVSLAAWLAARRARRN